MADVGHNVYFFVGLLCSTFCLVSVKTDVLKILTNVTWGEAFHECSKNGGRLYTKYDTYQPDDITPGSYWIGAKVQYTSWIWTENNESLFRYVGQGNVPASFTKMYEIPYDNQASRCYYECQINNSETKFVGLQENKCYCFKSRPQRLNVDDNQIKQHRCWGNFRECCGSSEAISIYNTDLSIGSVTWSLGFNGSCGYIFQSGNIVVEAEENCSMDKGYICQCSGNYTNDTCYHHSDTKSWFSSNSNCVLTQFNENNAKAIRIKMQGFESYWVGLKRSKCIVWIDHGAENEDTYNGTNGCYMVHKKDNATFSISNCNERHSALCFTNSKSSVVRSQSCEEQPKHTVSRSTTPKQTELGTDSSSSTSRARHEDQNEEFPGVAVGVGVGVVVVLVVGTVLSVIWMKRSRRFCFKDDSKSTMNDSGDVDDSNYDEINAVRDSAESHYEFEALSKITKTKFDSNNSMTEANPYDVTQETGEDEYNILHGTKPSDSSPQSNLYSHINMMKEKPNHANDYDVTVSNAGHSRDEYIGDVNNDDYDTAGSKFTSASDSTYNHIKGVVEGDYDTMVEEGKQEVDVDGDYSHLGSEHV